MFKDYHYLNRSVIELNLELTGLVINEIFTQEKEKLFLHIPDDKVPQRHLIISANSQEPYLLIKNEHYKAKKNTINFFSENLPDRIQRIEIALSDRLIKISLQFASIFFRIAGRKTNIYFLKSSGDLQSFKTINETTEEIITILNGESYTSSENKINKRIDSSSVSFQSAKKDNPFISRELFNEILIRCKKGSDITAVLDECVVEVLRDRIKIGYDRANNNAFFLPEKFYAADTIEQNSFDSYNEALQNYLFLNYAFARFINLKNQLTQVIEKEILYLSNKLNNLSVRIDKGPQDLIYYKYGRMLLANFGLLRKGIRGIKLFDPESNEELIIKLNPEHSAKESVDYYFSKAKDEKISFKKSEELFESTLAKFHKYKAINDSLFNTQSYDELKKISSKIIIKKNIKMEKFGEDTPRYRTFLIEGKFEVMVGKDSRSNDLLTMKIARQNDYFFHARGYAGSHVILKVTNTKEPVPKNVLIKVASIAAYFSKAKTSGTAPVAYTLRKFVRKAKGLNPGQVIVSKEKVLLVKPEIPSNAEEISDYESN